MIKREEKNLFAYNYGKSKDLQKSLKQVVKPNFAYQEESSKVKAGGLSKYGMRNQTHLGWKFSLRDVSRPLDNSVNEN